MPCPTKDCPNPSYCVPAFEQCAFCLLQTLEKETLPENGPRPRTLKDLYGTLMSSCRSLSNGDFYTFGNSTLVRLHTDLRLVQAFHLGEKLALIERLRREVLGLNRPLTADDRKLIADFGARPMPMVVPLPLGPGGGK